MSGAIGIELDAHAIRAVRLEGRAGRRSKVLETAWDPDGPAAAMGLLRESLGTARRIGVAIRLPLLLTKRVRLPPLPAAERARALRLEPQRYFPVRLEDLVIAVRDDDLVFAAREVPLSGWMRGLEELGPVDLVEPGPVALARALGQAGLRDAVVALDDGDRGVGIIEIRGGVVAAARRLYGGLAEAAPALRAALPPSGGRLHLSPWSDDAAAALAGELPDVELAPLPDLGTVPAPFLSACGAALGLGRAAEPALVPDDLRSRIVGRRRRELAVASLAAASAAVFAVASADAWRARATDRLADDVAGLRARAAPVLAMQEEVAAVAQRGRSVAGVQAARPDPLEVLLVLSRRLPPGAHIRTLRLTGEEWTIDGFATRAAEVTRALGNAPELSGVRVLAATNRAQVGDQANESFALAFRLAPRP